MPDVHLARARVKEGEVATLRDWFEEREQRESEVIETLQHEDVYTETAFVQSLDDTAYLYVYMEAKDIEKAEEAGDKEKYDIDEEHHEVFRKSLADDWESIETIGHFINPDLR